MDGGNGKGNRYGISIEICYSKSGGKKFEKAEENAAKLTALLLYERGWGLSKVTRHKDYSGKDCPKRTMKLGWSRFKKMVDVELKALKKGTTPSKPSTSKPTTPSKPKVKIDGYFGVDTIKATQRELKTDVDGIVSRQPTSNEKYLIRTTSAWKFTKNYKGGSLMVKKMQKLFGVEADGYMGKNTVIAMQKFLNKKGYKLKADGYMGEATVRAWQKYLNK